MNRTKDKESVKQSVSIRTLVFLVKEQYVLLGLKKKGFGKGKFLGIGGKKEIGETLEEAAIREVKEEIGVTVSKLIPRGNVTFYFPHNESWHQKVYLFLAYSWEGNPHESEEIRPEWFLFENIPYDKMWDDAKYWLEDMLKGKTIQQTFFFDKALQVYNSVLR